MNSFKGLLTIIMAGGKGERLFPLTRDKAKPAIIFGGIYRIIDFIFSQKENVLFDSPITCESLFVFWYPNWCRIPSSSHRFYF